MKWVFGIVNGLNQPPLHHVSPSISQVYPAPHGRDLVWDNRPQLTILSLNVIGIMLKLFLNVCKQGIEPIICNCFRVLQVWDARHVYRA